MDDSAFFNLYGPYFYLLSYNRLVNPELSLYPGAILIFLFADYTDAPALYFDECHLQRDRAMLINIYFICW